MSVIATAVKHMLAAGMDPAAIVAAVAEMEASTDRRSTGAKRQARYRERIKASQTVTDDACDADDGGDPSPQSPPLKAPPDPLKITPPLTPQPVVDCARDSFPRPDGVDPQAWKDFLANRKRKRLANTPTAHKRLLDDLARLASDEWPPGKLIEHAAAKGWGGIYDPTESKPHVGKGNGGRTWAHVPVPSTTEEFFP